jgi:UDP-N-acetylglucosamine:LPS N-acetylglucosamine transferase
MKIMKEKKTILAISSGGGHWKQLMKIQSAFKDHNTIYATVDKGSQKDLTHSTLYTLPDANRNSLVAIAHLAIKLTWILLMTRPNVVVTTGAAPGYFAIRLGKLLGAKTIFIDSIANANQLSMSASLAVPHADITLSQWQEVAQENGIQYWGAVL